MQAIIDFLKNSPLKISYIEKEAKIYPSKLHYLLRGKRSKLTESETKRLLNILKKYGFQEN